jgi:hypothetical protein
MQKNNDLGLRLLNICKLMYEQNICKLSISFNRSLLRFLYLGLHLPPCLNNFLLSGTLI